MNYPNTISGGTEPSSAETLETIMLRLSQAGWRIMILTTPLGEAVVEFDRTALPMMRPIRQQMAEMTEGVAPSVPVRFHVHLWEYNSLLCACQEFERVFSKMEVPE